MEYGRNAVWLYIEVKDICFISVYIFVDILQINDKRQ
jgi:hypothetical protein